MGHHEVVSAWIGDGRSQTIALISIDPEDPENVVCHLAAVVNADGDIVIVQIAVIPIGRPAIFSKRLTLAEGVAGLDELLQAADYWCMLLEGNVHSR